jgi:hypothetical protein
MVVIPLIGTTSSKGHTKSRRARGLFCFVGLPADLLSDKRVLLQVHVVTGGGANDDRDIIPCPRIKSKKKYECKTGDDPCVKGSKGGCCE